MIPGHSALGGIEGALAEVRAAEADAARRLDEAMRQIAEAKATETEGYRDLAAFRLKSADGLGGRLTQVATRVRAVLALRASDRQTLDRNLQEVEAEIAKIAADRQSFAAALEAAEEQRRAVENAAQVGLAARNDYAAMRAEAEQAARVAGEAEKKAKIAEDELATKRKPYEDDALFMYLWKRGYGTSAYQAGNLARLLDGWVARLVRYHDARPNYATLTDIPPRLRAHADRAAALAVDAVEKVKALESDAFLKGGGTRADQAVAAERARLDQMDKARAEAEARHDQLEGQIEAFGKGEDPRYREAVAMLAEVLSAEDLNRLYQDARATPSPDDEAIVTRIGAARNRQDDLQAEVERIRAEIADHARRRTEVSQVATGFRRQRYDADGSTFDNDVVGSLLRGLVTGVITAADYWARMEQGRRWSQGQSGNWGGGTWGGGGSWGGGGTWGGGSGGNWGPGPWSGDGSSGGSSGGGSWGGGGRTDNSDFETGGKF